MSIRLEVLHRQERRGLAQLLDVGELPQPAHSWPPLVHSAPRFGAPSLERPASPMVPVTPRLTRPHRLRTRMPLDLRSPCPRSAPGVCAPQNGGFGAASLIRRARGRLDGSSGASLPLDLTKMLPLRRPAQAARLLLARVARVAADLSVRQTGAKLAAFSAQAPLLSHPLSLACI